MLDKLKFKNQKSKLRSDFVATIKISCREATHQFFILRFAFSFLCILAAIKN